MLKILYKTPEQVEFSGLFKRIEKLGYKRADVARELRVSRAAITNVLKAKSGVSHRTLVYMRGFLNRIETAKAEGQRLDNKFDKLDRAADRLALLEKYDPPGFAAGIATIDALYSNAVSSNSISEAAETALSSASSAKRLAQESEQKQKVESPSDNKRGPKPGAGGHSK